MDLNAWLQQMMRRQQQPAPQMDILSSLGTSGYGSPQKPAPTMPQPSNGGAMTTGSVPGIATPDGGYAGAGASQNPSTMANLGNLIFSKNPSPSALAMAGK